MTVKELSQLYYLNREIESDKKELRDLKSRYGVGSPLIDDMPHAKGLTKSQVEQLAADIVDLEAIIKAKQIQCIHERNRLRRYVYDIPDSLTRRIFELRFEKGMSWESVADMLGGKNTPDGVRMRCYRYMREE